MHTIVVGYDDTEPSKRALDLVSWVASDAHDCAIALDDSDPARVVAVAWARRQDDLGSRPNGAGDGHAAAAAPVRAAVSSHGVR